VSSFFSTDIFFNYNNKNNKPRKYFFESQRSGLVCGSVTTPTAETIKKTVTMMPRFGKAMMLKIYGTTIVYPSVNPLVAIVAGVAKGIDIGAAPEGV
jgi:hypothetical protein